MCVCVCVCKSDGVCVCVMVIPIPIRLLSTWIKEWVIKTVLWIGGWPHSIVVRVFPSNLHPEKTLIPGC